MAKPRGAIRGNPKVDVLPVGDTGDFVVIAGNLNMTGMRSFSKKPFAEAYAKRLRKVL